MIITNIKATRFKGICFDRELTPVNVVVGDNAAGKTAVPDALRVGLLGYHLGLGKLERATALLADGQDMEVTLKASNDVEWTQSWKPKPDGGVKYTGKVPFNIPPVLFDIVEFTKMTASERISYLFSMLDGAGTPADSLLETDIRSVTVAPVGVCERITTGLIADLKKSAAERDRMKKPVHLWLDAFIATLNESLKSEKQREKILMTEAASLRGMSTAPASDVSAKEKEIADDVAALNQQLGALDSKIATAKRINQWIAQAKADIGTVTETADEIEEMKQQLSAELSSLQEENNQAGEGRLALANIDALIGALDEKLEEKEIAVTSLSGDLQGFTDNAKCPICECTDPKWIDAVRGKLQALVDKAGAEREELLKKRVSMLAERDTIVQRIGAMDKLDADVVKRVADIKATVAGLERAITAKKKLADLEVQLTENGNPLDGERATLQNSLKDAQARLDDLREKSKARLAAEANRRILMEKEEAQIESTCRKEVLGEVIANLRMTQAQMVQEAIEPLFKLANAFMRNIVDGQAAYQDESFGLLRDGKFIHYKVLSGLEKSLLLAGIAVALASKSPIKLVVLDEFLVTVANKTKIANRMLELVANKMVDQFIYIDVDAGFWAGMEGVNVIKV